MTAIKSRRGARLKRKVRVRRRLHGTADKPRLTVYRSNRTIYAQLVDDDRGHTVVWADGRKAAEAELPEGVDAKRAEAYRVGKAIAELARAQGLEQVVFDRNGYLYHGRVAALAQGARDGGLKF
jgi:large subunit ribosomal protein L18